MPLPAALAKKLSKRGIITSKVEITKNSSYKGYEGCPNKYNIYHNCTKFCMIRWKVGILEPTSKYVKQRERLLRKYPLPLNWREIYDRGCGRFYYWDIKNDVVTWLPPKHPKSKVSHSAAYLREEKVLQTDEPDRIEEPRKQLQDVPEKDSKKYSSRYKGNSKYRESTDLHLDPMDPAAYSDIPKGTWASGLEAAKSDLDAPKPAKPKPKIPPGPVYQIKNYHPQSNHKKN